MPPKKPLEKRFLAKINKDESGCWLWTGSTSGQGYGRIGNEGKVLAAHRVAWELFNGPIPDDLWVLHRCDVPACVNPDHLFLGNAGANTRDMLSKDRQGWDRSDGYSGKLVVRMEPELHGHLKAEARKRGISLNLYMATLLAGASSFKAEK